MLIIPLVWYYLSMKLQPHHIQPGVFVAQPSHYPVRVWPELGVDGRVMTSNGRFVEVNDIVVVVRPVSNDEGWFSAIHQGRQCYIHQLSFESQQRFKLL